MIRNDLQWITAWANVARLLPALPGACLKVQRRGLGSWLPSVAGCNGCSAIASVLEIVWSTALQPTDEGWDLMMGAVPYGIAGKPPTRKPHWLWTGSASMIIISSYIIYFRSTGNLVRKLLHLALCLKRSEATYHQHRFQLKNSCAMCHPRPVASRSRMRSPSP